MKRQFFFQGKKRGLTQFASPDHAWIAGPYTNRSAEADVFAARAAIRDGIENSSITFRPRPQTTVARILLASDEFLAAAFSVPRQAVFLAAAIRLSPPLPRFWFRKAVPRERRPSRYQPSP